jgi:hypothetical protein
MSFLPKEGGHSKNAAEHFVHIIASGITLCARFVLDAGNRSEGMRTLAGWLFAEAAGRFFSRRRLEMMNRERSVSRNEELIPGKSSYGLMPGISMQEINSGAGGVPSKAPKRAFLGWFSGYVIQIHEDLKRKGEQFFKAKAL